MCAGHEDRGHVVRIFESDDVICSGNVLGGGGDGRAGRGEARRGEASSNIKKMTWV